ncbi:MAG: hypothetical protein ABIH92_00815 [Nanoarchaeota archaeon]
MRNSTRNTIAGLIASAVAIGASTERAEAIIIDGNPHYSANSATRYEIPRKPALNLEGTLVATMVAALSLSYIVLNLDPED